jgi:outer membrane receptor for ferrienterochelin and colicins
MKFIRIFAICILLFSNSYAQNSLEITVKDADSGEALVGASVFIQSLNAGGSTNNDGYLKLENLPDGTLSIKINYLGYESQTVKVSLPSQTTLTILMEHDHDEMEEVVISSTRSSRTIQNIPTRVEFIGGEELQEKVNMKPGDIRMVLNESTGIITQITSAMSGNASIRIQGLDGRYTQILKDGLPLFSGAAAGLGLLQIPPLDLKQVEVIKGSTSTLYGGGAIAGMVNLISKTPEEEASLELLLNATSGGGLDVSAFYGKMGDKIGITTYAAFNQNTAYDPSDLGLSAIPEFQRFTLNPRLFFNPSASTKMNFGINSSIEERIGGDMAYLNDRENNTGYFESNNSTRLSSQFGMTHRFTDNKQLEIKNSLNHFDRELSTPAYVFDGTQFSTFSEINYSIEQNESEWIVGVNLWD